MNCDPSPSSDFSFRELDLAEQRLFTQNAFHQGHVLNVAFVDQGKGKDMDMSRTQCYICKKYGHIASNCGKKLCNYCMRQGHITKECHPCPQNHRSIDFPIGKSGSTTENSSLVRQVLTLEMVKQMVLLTYEAWGWKIISK